MRDRGRGQNPPASFIRLTGKKISLFSVRNSLFTPENSLFAASRELRCKILESLMNLAGPEPHPRRNRDFPCKFPCLMGRSQRAAPECGFRGSLTFFGAALGNP
jgi:hypothetical protein